MKFERQQYWHRRLSAMQDDIDRLEDELRRDDAPEVVRQQILNKSSQVFSVIPLIALGLSSCITSQTCRGDEA